MHTKPTEGCAYLSLCQFSQEVRAVRASLVGQGFVVIGGVTSVCPNLLTGLPVTGCAHITFGSLAGRGFPATEWLPL